MHTVREGEERKQMCQCHAYLLNGTCDHINEEPPHIAIQKYIREQFSKIGKGKNASKCARDY
jgi:hypothetical protein